MGSSKGGRIVVRGGGTPNQSRPHLQQPRLRTSLFECGVDGGEYVEQVGARLRRVELEGRRVVLGGHHDEARQGHLRD